jgi:hypothetical protein
MIMKINGRILRPSNLQERRMLHGLGIATPVRVPRNKNPFHIARQLRNLAKATSANLAELREALSRPRALRSPGRIEEGDEQSNRAV